MMEHVVGIVLAFPRSRPVGAQFMFIRARKGGTDSAGVGARAVHEGRVVVALSVGYVLSAVCVGVDAYVGPWLIADSGANPIFAVHPLLAATAGGVS